MIQKIELGKKHELFAEPTPLGLIGLAVGCAALLPIALVSERPPASRAADARPLREAPGADPCPPRAGMA